MFTECYYQPGKSWCIDVIAADGLTSIRQDTEEQVRQRYPDAIRIDLDAFCQIAEALVIQAPERITEERWDEMLNVLPPHWWVNRDGEESFRICEAYSGCVRSCFVRLVDGSMWECRQSDKMTHADLVRLCRAVRDESNT